MIFATAPIALAHAELEGAIPAPNATVTESPKKLTLKFSEQIQLGTSVTLLDANGTKIALTDAQLGASDPDGRTVLNRRQYLGWV